MPAPPDRAHVFAAAAAARRVDGAYQALLSEIDAPDLVVFPGCGDSGAFTGCTGPPSEVDTEQQTEQLSRNEAIDKVRPNAVPGLSSPAADVEQIPPSSTS